jgi:hypothetical protein
VSAGAASHEIYTACAAKPRYGVSQTNKTFEATSVGSSRFPARIRLAFEAGPSEAPCRRGPNESNAKSGIDVDEVMARSFRASRIFSKASRNPERRCNLEAHAITEFTRLTRLWWTLLVAGILAAFVVALLGFVYLKTRDDGAASRARVL